MDNDPTIPLRIRVVIFVSCSRVYTVSILDWESGTRFSWWVTRYGCGKHSQVEVRREGDEISKCPSFALCETKER